MGKRFTDTQKWSDDWFAELDPDMKLIWLYLVDNCSHSGVWKRSIKLLKYHTSSVRTQADIESILGDRIVIFDNDKWFIPKFIRFQYPTGLNSNKPAIIGVRQELKLYNLVGLVNKLFGNDYITIEQSLDNSCETIKDKDKDKDKDIYNKEIGNEPREENYRVFGKLSIANSEIDKLLGRGFSKEQIDTCLDKIENYKKNTGYNSLYLTALNWLKRDFPEMVEKQPEVSQEEMDKIFGVNKRQIDYGNFNK